MLRLLGLTICIFQGLIIYQRLKLTIFGKEAQGLIVGYGDGVAGSKAFISYPYLVHYEFDGKSYEAKALESARGTERGSFSDKNLNKEVKIYFSENKPEEVTIKEFKGRYYSALLFFILGALAFFLLK